MNILTIVELQKEKKQRNYEKIMRILNEEFISS